MGASFGKFFNTSHGLRESLRNMPFRLPNELDYEFFSSETLTEEQVKTVFDSYLQNTDGSVNKEQFLRLFQVLQPENPELVENLVVNVFNALKRDPGTDYLTLNEFLITFALLSRKDLREKLTYAFNIYDYNKTETLDPEVVKEIIYGIFDLFQPMSEEKNIADLFSQAYGQLKITQVVKKDDFINGLLLNDEMYNVFSSYE